MRVFVWLGLCFAAVLAPTSGSSRIVGGSLTTINNYPDIVAILVQDGPIFRHDCGGSILNNRSVLSAAHCFVPAIAARYRFRVGSTFANSGGVVHNVNSVIINPNWSAITRDSDIAIVRSATNFVYNNVVRPASIAGANYNLADNQVVWAAGWGAISTVGPWSEQLRHVQIWSINQGVCNQRYGGTITANMLCSGWLDVGSRDQCSGDSGGPLYHNGVVVGVCSFGAGCADPRYPGVNVRVSRFTNWIQANA